MHIAAVQFDIAWEDKPVNHARIERLLDDADIPPGAFVLLPEMADSGFSFNLDRTVDDRSIEWGRTYAARRGIWLQIGYSRRAEDGRGRNCATIISPQGDPIATYEKIHPFSYGREIEHFSGGRRLVLCDISGTVFAPLICYDLRFPEIWRLAAQAGAEIFTIGANWPAARQEHWRALLIARAIENQAWVVGVNRVGRDPHLEYRGGSMIISPKGEIVAEADDRDRVIQAALDLEVLHAWRKTFPALADMKREHLGSIEVVRAGETAIAGSGRTGAGGAA